VTLRVEPLSEANGAAWAALFEACGCACYCRWWHFGGTKNEWLDRSFHAPETSRDEQLVLVRAGADEARGLLALDGAEAVGWMKLAPRARLPKLRNQGAYRPLDLGPDDGVWSIGCFLVRPDRRKSGVARALVEAADAHVRAWGGSAIEAYPRVAAPPLHDEEVWMGPESVLRAAGYVLLAGEPPYPVLRKTL
jgi:GNAT superfamily N-acetyltransferase